ncbi:MAG: hypothetical protein K0S23_1433 [Fluviicola sp.]|jgi:hypothetical protein|uniref:hypothetical protein n=1 Tax=Fluviicola sp. TaxID=1917219 RepID=UPI0026085FF2|nr:hypothetical protein [Fluviicola sp.]MDF3027126.1 hypothetical protein [Fluviicola sp.]
MRKNRLLFIFFISISSGLFSQERNEIIQQRVEFIAEQSESEELDLTNIFDQLNYFFDNPINLNNTNPDELRALGLLTEVQITDALLHVEQFGKFISIYELQSLKYWDLNTISLVLPFVKVDDRLENMHITFKDAIKNGKIEWYTRYQRTPEQKKGYTPVSDSVLNNSNSFYRGNPDKYYTRFRYTYRTNISLGVTAEKDAGEEFFKGSQKNGFDYYSFHAFYKGGKYNRAVAAGDYQIQIGQGLNTWSGYAFGKSADIFSSKKAANLLRPYTSVDENRFFRGGAAIIGYKKWNLLTFYSNKKIDGSGISDTLTDDLEFVTTIDLSGLHRTNSEIARKNKLSEQVIGNYLSYNSTRFNAGLAVVNQQYSQELQKDTVPYNLYAFRGKNTTAISGDYNFVLRNFNFFGEVSYSTHSKSFAQLHGLMAILDPNVSISVIYRNYSKGYYSFYNNGFSEGSNTQNETGIFSGIKVKLAPAWSVSSYVDFFRFPWLKYQVDAPSKGHEFLVQPTYKPNKVFEIYARFRQQTRQKNSRNTDGSITEIENVVQNNYRLNMSYKVLESFTLKSRLEYVTINRKSNAAEDGWIFTQDFLFKPKNLPFDLTLRYALFDTDSYDTRIYTFENNALYVFSIPAYYYQGSRAYAMIRFSFLRHCDLWIRYGTFLYSNRTVLSSGPEEIKGSRKSDITVQFRLNF